MSSPAGIRRIVELVSEDNLFNEFEDSVTQFPMIREIHDELTEFLRNKIFESIQLQQFFADKEIEFLRKYIDFLSKSEVAGQGSYNNQNELAEHRVEMTSSERASELDYSRNRLNGLLLKRTRLGNREQKACNVFSSTTLEQIRILSSLSNGQGQEEEQTSSSSPSSSPIFKISNNSWNCALSESLTLRKIKILCQERLFDKNPRRMETLFWIAEVPELLEKLDVNQKHVALGIIFEMASSCPPTTINNNFADLLAILLKNEQFVDLIFSQFTTENLRQNVNIISVLAAIFVKIKEDDPIKSRTANLLSSSTVNILEWSDMTADHMALIVQIFENVTSHLQTFSESFENMFTLIESKSAILDGSMRTRANRLRRPDQADDSFHLPVISTVSSPSSPSPQTTLTTSRSYSNIRNFTVIEHPVHNENEEPSQQDPQELRRQIEEKTRRQINEEYRKIKEIERIEEEMRKKILEELRLKDEEEAKRKKALEEMERKRVEQENELRREEVRRRQEELKCTFLKNVQIFLHSKPNKVFSANMFDGKVIGIYFSGCWCGPSLTFTPILAEFYSKVQDDFEVLFISSDRSEAEMNWYLSSHHGNWFHLPLGAQYGKQLNDNWQIRSIPTLVIVRPNGSVISMNGRQEVENSQNAQQLVRHWKSFL